jgi:4-hydroxybenzoate polyprenyltransferase
MKRGGNQADFRARAPRTIRMCSVYARRRSQADCLPSTTAVWQGKTGGRLRVYLRLGRVSNLPTVWTNVLAGMVLVGPSVDIAILLPLFVAFTGFYAGGMFLNDAFDLGHDMSLRPDRPIPSGLISAAEVFGVGYGLLAIGLLIVIWLGGSENWAAAVSGVALIAIIVAYDAYHKNNPLGPWMMGFCRALIYVTTAFVVAPRLPGLVIAAAALLLIYVTALTYVATRADAGPSLIARLIAGVSILDAVLIAASGHPHIAAVASLGFAGTLLFQRVIRGT